MLQTSDVEPEKGEHNPIRISECVEGINQIAYKYSHKYLQGAKINGRLITADVKGRGLGFDMWSL